MIIKNTRMKIVKGFCLFLLLSASAITVFGQKYMQTFHNTLQSFKGIRLNSAWCKTTDSTLIVSSGKIKRIYKLSKEGFVTVSLGLLDKEDTFWNNKKNNEVDWNFGFDDDATLNNITASIDDDSGFTSKHITVVSDFDYPNAGIKLRYIIWVYPESGIRTQIELKAKANKEGSIGFKNDQVEYIPYNHCDAAITAFGYYNNTQRRNTDTTPILKENKILSDTVVNWASGLVIQHRTKGLIIIKESHKCVNQPGIVTGSFDLTQTGVAVTGPGLLMKDLEPGIFKKCWATWIIPYTGDSVNGILALKKFDRFRYPVNKNDIYIMANTWGSTTNPTKGKYASRQANVSKEIASQADLGIDVQQIDDGWQGLGYKYWRPVVTSSLDSIKYDVYPDGWTNVKKYGAQKGVTLGLWASWVIPENDLVWNYNHGGFRYYKLDFASLKTKSVLDDLMHKVRSFILYTDHKVRVNWDVTENAPRVGYFYAREYGNVYLENRKPSNPVNTIYKPHLVLRDAWQVAKYLNLNQFQITVQNIDSVNRQLSDAYLYSNPYSTAISLMGSPIFFQETQLYNQKDRNGIRSILKSYKQYRDEMYKGYVFPIGHIPDDASWTGFQDVVSPDIGYLLIFRELKNKSRSQKIPLKFIRGQYMMLINILTGQKKKIFVNKDGLATFTINNSADFRFYRYRIH